MSGDCPHNLHEQQLALTDRPSSPSPLPPVCRPWDRSMLLVTHNNYISLVNELKSELNSLSSQVAVVQQDFKTHDQLSSEREEKLETSLRELESQNDTLKHALEQACSDSEKSCLELHKSNEELQCQVEELQRNIHEKEQNIIQLNSLVERLQCQVQHSAECCRHNNSQELQEMSLKMEQSQRRAETLARQLEQSQRQEHFLLSETRKLNEELNASRRKHDDLSVQVHRLALLLKKQESCRSNICSKYEELESSYEEQSKQLRAAVTQMNCLQERLTVMDNRQEEHKMERTLLREEVLALKDKETHLMSLHKNLSDRLLKTEKELYSAHDVIKEQQAIMQRNECAQRDNVNRLRDANNDLRKQLTKICDDYKRLEGEFKKQCEVRKQNEKVIESFRKWKEAQLKADDSTRASFKQYEEHIKLLLEEKQKFLQQYRQLHHDHCMLQSELDRLKTRPSNFNATGNSAPNSSLNQRMEMLRNTTRRLNEQCNTLKSDDPSRPTSGSKLQ